MLTFAPIIVVLVSLIVSVSSSPSCRFATTYTASQIIADPNSFLSDLLFWEGKFHQNEIGYNTANGMSYDGTLLDSVTGLNGDKHPFSAASKESLQNMVYAHAIAGSSEAARFLSPEAPNQAPAIAVGILKQKLQAYRAFNATYPGFGGFLPWYIQNGSEPLTPTWDWINRVPALDNGENLWAIFAVVQVLRASNVASYRELGKEWQAYLDYTKTTAKKIFYAGAGKVCAVTDLNQTLPVDHPNQSYRCEGAGTLNDPYEGELFAWWLDFYGGLGHSDREALWELKRPQLVRVNYQNQGHPAITVQKGTSIYLFDDNHAQSIIRVLVLLPRKLEIS